MKETDYNKKLNIRDWNVSDRPREKYLEKGFQSLTNAELLAILIRNGSEKESAVDLGIKLLRISNDDLDKLANMELEQLMAVHGIGQAKAISIKAAFELGQRRRASEVTVTKKIRFATDVVEFMQDKIAHLPHEEFWVLFLNQSSKILASENFGKGGLTSTVVDVRLLLKNALKHNATGIVLCHNHPSGDVNPSKQDITLTKQIEEAASYFDIRIIDHIIVHQDAFYSFTAESLI